MSTRKLMIGFWLRISQKIRKPSPSTNARTSVCTRPNGSPSQSHSCPLLSITSQADMTSASTPRPMRSKFTGRRSSSARSFWM